MSEMTYEEAVDRLEYMERLGRRNVSTTAARVILKRCEELEAEIKRRDDFIGCDGCSTGDCPHETVSDCIKAQADHIRELEAALAAQPKEQP